MDGRNWSDFSLIWTTRDISIVTGSKSLPTAHCRRAQNRASISEAETGLGQHIVEIVAEMNAARSMIHIEIATRGEDADTERSVRDRVGCDLDTIAMWLG